MRVVTTSIDMVGDAAKVMFVFFFFQAEDGIRDIGVTGVQTCALPIYSNHRSEFTRFKSWFSAAGVIC